MLHKIEPNGDPSWVLPFTYGLRGTPAHHNGIVYVLGNPGNLAAVDITGTEPKLLWTFKIKTEEADAEGFEDYYTNSPAVKDDGTVYFGWVDGYVYSVNPEGKLNWKYSTASDEDERYPEIIGGTSLAKSGSIIFGDSDG